MITLSVSLERFWAIRYPLKIFEKGYLIINISVIFTVIYNVPRFFEFETSEIPCSNIIPNVTSDGPKVHPINDCQKTNNCSNYSFISLKIHKCELNLFPDAEVYTNKFAAKSGIRSNLYCVDEILCDRDHSIFDDTDIQCCNISRVSFSMI